MHLKAHKSVRQAHAPLARFIEFYKTRRPHSMRDRTTPDKFYFASLPAMTKAA